MNSEVANDEKRPQHPLVGTVVEPYAILDVIAAGGMGVVFKARHMLTDRIVALKLLPSELARDESNVQRVKLEAKALAQLKHPNIITTFDFGFTYMQEPFIVMEYVNGESLKEVLDREVLLPVDRALNIFLQVVDGMRYAHSAKILHRDLKPHNIMVSDEPEPDHVKVLDFGVAKLAEYSQQITRTGEVVGSPLYMSPEQCTGKPTDHRCDIYSIGVMMFETLTGNPPFRGENYISTVHLKCTKLPPNFKDVVPGRVFPERLEMIVLKCLEIEPDHRYSSMAELKADLELVAGVVPKVERPKTSTSIQLALSPRASANDLPPHTTTNSGPGPGEIGWQPSWAGASAPASAPTAVPNRHSPEDQWSDSIVSGISETGTTWQTPSSPNMMSDENWASESKLERPLSQGPGLVPPPAPPHASHPAGQDLASLSAAIEASASIGSPFSQTSPAKPAPQNRNNEEVTGDRPQVHGGARPASPGPSTAPARDPQNDSHFILTWDEKTGPAWSATSATPQKPKGPAPMSGTRNKIQGVPGATTTPIDSNPAVHQAPQSSMSNSGSNREAQPLTSSQQNGLIHPAQPRSAAIRDSQSSARIPQGTQGGPSQTPPPPSQVPPNPWGGGGFASLADTGWGPPPEKDPTDPGLKIAQPHTIPQPQHPTPDPDGRVPPGNLSNQLGVSNQEPEQTGLQGIQGARPGMPGAGLMPPHLNAASQNAAAQAGGGPSVPLQAAPGAVPAMSPTSIGIPVGQSPPPAGVFPAPPRGVQIHAPKPTQGSMPVPQGLPGAVPDPANPAKAGGSKKPQPASPPADIFQPMQSPAAKLAQSLLDDESTKLSTEADEKTVAASSMMKRPDAKRQPPAQPSSNVSPTSAGRVAPPAAPPVTPAPTPAQQAAQPTAPPSPQPGWNSDSDDRFAVGGSSPIHEFAERMRDSLPGHSINSANEAAEFKSYEPVSLAELNAIKTPNVAKSAKPAESGLSKTLHEQQTTTTGSSPIYNSTSANAPKIKSRMFDDDSSRPQSGAASLRFSTSRGDTDGRKVVLISLVGVAILAIIATACFLVYQHNLKTTTASGSSSETSTAASPQKPLSQTTASSKTKAGSSQDETEKASTASATTSRPAVKPKTRIESAQAGPAKKTKPTAKVARKPKRQKPAVAKVQTESPDVPAVPRRRRAYSTWSSYYGNE